MLKMQQINFQYLKIYLFINNAKQVWHKISGAITVTVYKYSLHLLTVELLR